MHHDNCAHGAHSDSRRARHARDEDLEVVQRPLLSHREELREPGARNTHETRTAHWDARLHRTLARHSHNAPISGQHGQRLLRKVLEHGGAPHLLLQELVLRTQRRHATRTQGAAPEAVTTAGTMQQRAMVTVARHTP
jgi:hypothetical protein